MIKSLSDLKIERYVVEGIDEIYGKQYTKIPREKFDALIRLDPTFKEGQDKMGKYGKLIVQNMYKSNPNIEEDAIQLREHFELLNKFEREIAASFKEKNGRSFDMMKDIRSLDDLIELTLEYKGEDSESEVDAKDKERYDKNREGIEVLFEDNNWVIFIPLDYRASCYFGGQWCTAKSSSSDGNFRVYTKTNNLVIIQNKKKKSDRWQFWFTDGNRKSEFKNINNKDIYVIDFLKATNLPAEARKAIQSVDVEHGGKLRKYTNDENFGYDDRWSK
jgi:hypothetical protein